MLQLPALLRHQGEGPSSERFVRLSSDPVTLQDTVDALLDHHDLARSTRRVYRASLTTLVAELGLGDRRWRATRPEGGRMVRDLAGGRRHPPRG
jgi:hypothetical protein